jgi:hypothetical protein
MVEHPVTGRISYPSTQQIWHGGHNALRLTFRVIPKLTRYSRRAGSSICKGYRIKVGISFVSVRQSNIRDFGMNCIRLPARRLSYCANRNENALSLSVKAWHFGTRSDGDSSIEPIIVASYWTLKVATRHKKWANWVPGYLWNQWDRTQRILQAEPGRVPSKSLRKLKKSGHDWLCEIATKAEW